jgi:hypothetical protein
MSVNKLVGGNGHMSTSANAVIEHEAAKSPGASVTIHVSYIDRYDIGELPDRYSVAVCPSQPCVTSVTRKTSRGFDVVLTPVSESATLKAGTIDVSVTG